jgi:hypothetical protein
MTSSPLSTTNLGYLNNESEKLNSCPEVTGCISALL